MKKPNKPHPYSYYYALIGGLIFLFILPGKFSVFNWQMIIGFGLGILSLWWILFWQNKMTHKVSQNFLWGALALAFPFIAYGILIGGLLGIFGIFLWGIFPLLLWTPLAAWMVKEPQKIPKRIGLFFLSVVTLIVIFVFSPVSQIIANKLNASQCKTRGGTWIKAKNQCHTETETNIKNQLFGLQITIPEEKNLVAPLTQEESIGLGGHIFSKTGGKVSGNVVAFTDQIHQIDPFLFVLPFSANLGGSGNFYYLGLFSHKNQKIEHLDSFFIGDRIKIESVDSKNISKNLSHYQVSAHYLDRTLEQSFAEKPTVQKTLELKVISTPQFRFVPNQSCEEAGGQTLEKTWNDQKYTVCLLEDNRQCEINAFADGSCPPEGFKITGYENDAQIFCKITGNEPDTKSNTCLVNGKKCGMEDFFSGHCEKTETTLPPASLIGANIKQTELSADMTLRECFISNTEGVYVTYQCVANINQIFASKSNKIPAQITYRKTLEATSGVDVKKMEGKRILASVDSHTEANLSVFWSAPDVAYDFEYSPMLKKIFENKALDQKSIKNSQNVPSCDEAEAGMQCAL